VRAVVYLANQYALLGSVNPDGTFTVSGIPSGTYALAFVGCDTSQPAATVHDPVDPGRSIRAQWWHDVDLSLAGTTEGGPDPIAQHATLLPVGAGQQLTGYDQCFGCQQSPPQPPPPPPAPPPAVPPPAVSPPAAGQPIPVTITITAHTRARGTITLAFAASLAAASSTQGIGAAGSATITHTATCATRNAATGRTVGPSSPITLTGVEDTATYSCLIAAAIDGVPVGSSAIVIVDPLGAAQLPPTGTDVLSTAWLAALIAAAGVLIVAAAARSRGT
jgi:hypothetical protein